MARSIRNLKGQNHDKGRVVGSREKIAEVAADMVLFVDEAQPEGPCDVGAQE